MSISYDVDADM